MPGTASPTSPTTSPPPPGERVAARAISSREGLGASSLTLGFGFGRGDGPVTFSITIFGLVLDGGDGSEGVPVPKLGTGPCAAISIFGASMTGAADGGGAGGPGTGTGGRKRGL